MSADSNRGGRRASPETAPALRQLLPPGPDTDPQRFVDALQLDSVAARAAGRPLVVLNMASTADGRASIRGHSGAIGNRADHALFHALRGVVDAVLVGAGTVRDERYGRLIRDPAQRRARVERGLSAEPLACIVSASLDLPADLPLLAEPESHVVVMTPSRRAVQEVAARVEYVRAGQGDACDLTVALEELHERFSVRTVLCEGGPHLNHALLRAGLVGELYLTLAPLLAGGDDPERPTLRIVAGDELPAPTEMELASVLESESQLFLRYLVRASAGAGAEGAPSAEEAGSP
jgi:riboflavin-specific deaminase-like protein